MACYVSFLMQGTFFYTMFCLWYLFTGFLYYFVHWGVQGFDLDGYYSVLQTTLELHFGVSKENQGQSWYPLAIFAAFVFGVQQSMTYPTGDTLSISCIITMNTIAWDVDRAIKSGEYSAEEVQNNSRSFESSWVLKFLLTALQILEFIRAQKRLTRKFNRAFGLLMLAYAGNSLPYYALHTVDMFEVVGIMNILSMVTWLIFLALAVRWAINILVMVRQYACCCKS